jgi:ribosomal protein S18 acetylase RimI-like enzyme
VGDAVGLGDKVCGWDWGWLYAVAVLKEQRRSGTGAELVKYAMQSLRENGCIKVNLQIRPTNTEVAAFYKALGFATEERLSMGAFIV